MKTLAKEIGTNCCRIIPAINIILHSHLGIKILKKLTASALHFFKREQCTSTI